ncbi:MAG: polysaccharide biosynthesis/export family protein [Pyrinomonadaceae bacterium]
MVRVRVPNFYKVVVTSLLLSVSCVAVFAQRNNPDSANPVSRVEPQEQPVAQMQPVNMRVGEWRPTTSQQAPKTARNIVAASTPLTETYKIGVGDVLFINLKNAPRAAGYYTVRRDGTIDFPLAGEGPSVVEKTVEQVEEVLAAAITLYSNPLIEVKVREYVSHKITVSGMAERVGETSLQREAIPLFAIRADALVSSAATKVNIRRGDLAKVETYDLSDEKTGDVPVYPGNSVEFTADGHRSLLASSRFFYIAGEVNATGQKQFTDGMTLFQAVTAAGGAKGNPKKATLRRKSDRGTLNVAEFNLRAIRDGKATDPEIAAGDMIQISN